MATPNPVRRAYELYTSFKGRPSWDLTAVLAAVRDPNQYWSIKSEGYCKVDSDGTNQWLPSPNRHHSYLVEKMPASELAKLLNDLLVLPPQVK